MDSAALRQLLDDVAAGRVRPEQAADQLAIGLGRDVPDAMIDRARAARTGVPEVVLGEWKTAEQIATIVAGLAAGGAGALATRCSPDKAAHVCRAVEGARYHELARAIVVAPAAPPDPAGAVAIACAGTSDLPVAEEAAVTAAFLGAEVHRVVDVGVAGLHRLLARLDELRAVDALIVVAGMEGALPSVVAGLVDAPLFAVPTSVGYGVSAGGLVAMAAMLSSCAPGVAVVNIDNGFGAAVAAVRAARRARAARGGR
ncbi:MAG: nickel pincer cofactor biosynthesis protein LarB [Kofleriaceae bacterium]|nr:nickel pincer cofactor biosynthesis protein LarB [Kofleriaceae bacterium]MBP9171406.1 nickel pincer cofactor biosynthesis protein LarB [Kofleriaceae bacterium]MBP9863130.1 nickel pincer cofactor biosynthesis protein LarB [Kofleriaceae bacterium]